MPLHYLFAGFRIEAMDTTYTCAPGRARPAREVII